MSTRKRWLLAAALGLGIVATGIGVVLGQTESTDEDQPLTGSDRDRAAQAALEAVGEGTVTEVEVGDDGAAYSVEIRLPDGSQVEVQLDESFTVTGTESDDE